MTHFIQDDSLINLIFHFSKFCTLQEKPVVECSLNTKNKKMTGTIKYESETLVTCSECGFMSSMDTTSYRGNIIGFLGAKDGKLSKVKTNLIFVNF